MSNLPTANVKPEPINSPSMVNNSTTSPAAVAKSTSTLATDMTAPQTNPSKLFLSPMCLTNEQIKQEPVGKLDFSQCREPKSAFLIQISSSNHHNLLFSLLSVRKNNQNRKSNSISFHLTSSSPTFRSFDLWKFH